jgi:hypothetical protein
MMQQADGGHQIERLRLVRLEVGGIRDQEFAMAYKCSFSAFDAL